MPKRGAIESRLKGKKGEGESGFGFIAVLIIILIAIAVFAIIYLGVIKRIYG